MPGTKTQILEFWFYKGPAGINTSDVTLFRAELELLPRVGDIKHMTGNRGVQRGGRTNGNNYSPNLPLLLRFDFTLGLLLVGLVGTLAKLFGSSDENKSDAGSSSTIAKEGTVLFTTTRFLPRNLDLCCCLTLLGGLARKLEPCSRDSGGRRSVAGPKVESGWTVGRKDSSGADVSKVSAPRRRGSGDP